MKKIERLCLLGGSFDPIHEGHLALARAFGQAVEADRVLLMPAKQPPHKPGRRLESEAHRLAMCRLAVAGDSLLQASDLEMRLPPPSYTVHTLRALKNEYPHAELFLLCGGDMLLNLETWREFPVILTLCTVCAVPRGEDDLAKVRSKAEEYRGLGGQVVILDMPPVEVSSTEIRRRLACGESIEDLVPQSVAEYISEQSLYKE